MYRELDPRVVKLEQENKQLKEILINRQSFINNYGRPVAFVVLFVSYFVGLLVVDFLCSLLLFSLLNLSVLFSLQDRVPGSFAFCFLLFFIIFVFGFSYALANFNSKEIVDKFFPYKNIDI